MEGSVATVTLLVDHGHAAAGRHQGDDHLVIVVLRERRERREISSEEI